MKGMNYTWIPGLVNKSFWKTVTARATTMAGRQFGQVEQSETIREDMLNYRGLKLEDVLGQKRDRYVSDTRKLIFYFVYKNTTLSLKKIGELLNKDHATVLHHVRNMEDILTTNDKFSVMARELAQRFSLKL